MRGSRPWSAEELSGDVSAIERQLRFNRRVGSALISRHADNYWVADFGRLGGKRYRIYRRSPSAIHQAALQKTKEIKEHGRLASDMTSAQRYVAVTCFQLIACTGSSLLEVVNDFMKRHPLSGNARTVDQVRIELVEKKRSGERRARYVKDFDYRLRCLVKAVGNIPISSVTAAMLECELVRHADWSSSTVHGTVTSWKVIFNYAVKQGYALTNPCKLLELPRKRRAKAEVLSALQVHGLLAGCITHAHMEKCLAYVAIGCFTGIRPEEMQRLRWEMFSLDAGLITIDGEDSKCGERGIVKISPNLATWLKPLAKTSGPVLEHKVPELRALCRTFLKLDRWPHDSMRHSFASYHYTFHRDIGEVCAQLRHGTGQLVFINHYYVVRPPAEAAYFWSIVRPVAFLTA